MNEPDVHDVLELLELLQELEARGLVVVEENDLGELRVSPTQAGVDAVRDRDREELPSRAHDAVKADQRGVVAAGSLQDGPLPFT